MKIFPNRQLSGSKFPNELDEILGGALEQVAAWLESPTLVVLAETGDYWHVLRDLMASARATGPLVHDARIAALCRTHGVSELWTVDRDFGRFPGLRVRNPLIADRAGETRSAYGGRRRPGARLRRRRTGVG